jgi:hypothetical protein
MSGRWREIAMKMKRWLDQLVCREDWASRALRLGLEAFERESRGARGPRRPSAGSGEDGARTSNVSMEPEPESVPTFP